MSEDLKALEFQRDELYRRLTSLGDFRLGTISATFNKCGKKRCVCAAKNHPGHGPNYRWTATLGGKTVAQHLRLGPEVDLVQHQMENGHRFLDWYQEAVELNAKICRLRPVPQIEDERELEAFKKKLRMKFAKKSRVK